jgi:ABC-type polysaccharide/polyol phosphate transport system ATPase subunit
MNDICIKVENLSKSFLILQKNNTALQVLKSLLKGNSLKRKLKVLDGVSCEIPKGEKLAILGRNGCGKTTFLRILTGIYDASSGFYQINGTSRILFKSSFGFNIHVPVVDNVYLLGAIQGLNREILNQKMEEILTTADLGELRYSTVRRLSVGQIQRLALSTFFHVKADLLIFDETFESLDPNFIQKCDEYFERLFQSNTTVVMSSHQGYLLKRYCTKAIWLDNGKVRMHGNFNEVHEAYEQSFLK